MSKREVSKDKESANPAAESWTGKLYDSWAATYDTVANPTRDLEGIACRSTLSALKFKTVIELGCGTGKNTVWLAERAEHLTAVDVSAKMQEIAKEKVGNNVEFRLADVTKPWDFGLRSVDLITCSLILEHVRELDPVFREAARHMHSGSHFYICELHPFKQYSGSKARFETDEGQQVLECFTHHISDFFTAGSNSGFSLIDLREWFDDDGKQGLPRLVSFLFRKK